MPVELAIPRLSMSMTEAVLTAWLKPAGATVAVGDLLFTVESEKTAMEVESQAAGELVHVAEAGSTLEAGAVVGYVLAPGEGIESAPVP
jgi:pyruvate/2-oxoglutarate dehydrogenase complex dihydrolipoamide acyltransferase (E2) component